MKYMIGNPCPVLLLVTLTGAVLAQGKETTTGVQVKVQPEKWDLGKVEAGRYQQVFDITNAGGGTLSVDEVRVSNPSRVSAAVAPIGTTQGQRFQLTVAVNTEGLEGAWTGYVTLHCNDPARPDVRIDLSAEPAPRADLLTLAYAEEGAGTEKVRGGLAKLPKTMRSEVLSIGDVKQLASIRALERATGVAQGGTFELFQGKEAFVTMDPDEALAAIGRVAEGKPLSLRKTWVHHHEEKTTAEAAVAHVLPPPVVVDLLIDPSCEECKKEFEAGTQALARKYMGKVSFNLRDITQPDQARIVEQAIDPAHRPPKVHAIAVVAGTTYVAGDVSRIFDALPKVLDEAILRATPPQTASSSGYSTEVRLGPPGSAVTAGSREESHARKMDEWTPWLLGGVILINCLILLRVSRARRENR